jgi:hypothetical protein
MIPVSLGESGPLEDYTDSGRQWAGMRPRCVQARGLCYGCVQLQDCGTKRKAGMVKGAI